MLFRSPFALNVDVWNDLLNGVSPNGDHYYATNDGDVYPFGDGILELNLYPGGGEEASTPGPSNHGPVQLAPGNFGTVDIGNASGSTADIVRQITEGPSMDDMAYHGGQLTLGDDGTLILSGDPGLSGGMKDALESIIGQPRTILLFSTVSGTGTNSVYTIVGFAGVRVLDVKLTGKLADKYVYIQPANVVDSTVIVDGSSDVSDFVYKPPTLVQ